MPCQRVLLALHRVGPYHHARFSQAAHKLNLELLETRPNSNEYPWHFVPECGYRLHRLVGGINSESDPPLAALDQQLSHLLAELAPDVIVCVGWADHAYQRLLIKATRLRLPVVIVSDSRERDAARRRLPEELKRLLLRGFSAAFVAGQESRSYLCRLGFPGQAIFQPWDVVDNSFFDGSPVKSDLSWLHNDEPHFLCASRFVEKKNHRLLLEGYALYQRQGGTWGLRLLGGGSLEHEIRATSANLPNPSVVRVEPFVQLEELRMAYHTASAFILASHTDQWGLVVNEAMAAGLPCLVSSGCGCAIDLIEHGRTGWCFDPMSPGALTSLMHAAEQQPVSERIAMVAAARDQLKAFSPEAFADGLEQAVEWAHKRPRFSRRAVLTAQLLSRRP